MLYRDFFRQAFEKEANEDFGPFDYQAQLAQQPWPDLLNVQTGMGKTAAVTLAWLWKRGWRAGERAVVPDAGTPRRLVYCLPMRVLVEQTYDSICGWLRRLEISAETGKAKVSVHVLMGGSNDTETWAEHPEEDMILIGTQDMLLSRALMRGYGMSRYKWPVHFALLHNDAMWVFDEVQLMGAGLATSSQLEAFRRRLPLARPSRSLWLSATLNPDWLSTVDMKPCSGSLRCQGISDEDRKQAGERLKAVKHIEVAPFSLSEEATSKKGLDAYIAQLCEFALNAHDPSGQTIVILNRVDRAQSLFRALRSVRTDRRDLLIHARFRPAERAGQARRLREEPSVDRIIVATQAVEAGVDISSKVLITELAPWSSLVQRFGRCNRYGEHNLNGGSRIVWIDAADDPDTARPYRRDELLNAREKMLVLADASPEMLPATDSERPLTAVLRRKDLLDLFNTDPDLSGFDVDVSDYIRDSDSPGIRVFWRDFANPDQPRQPAPDRLELCPISMGQARGLQKRGAWRWDSLDERWQKLTGEPRPGMTLLLRASDGGYDPDVGFDAEIRKPVPLIAPPPGQASEHAFGADWRSRQRVPVLLTEHLAHVAEHARQLCRAVEEEAHSDAIIRAGRWHDLGKAHEVFQESMHSCDRAPPGLLAKSPCGGGRYSRQFFRHELASMLAWLEQHHDEPDADLIAYLILAHHGKVRMSLRAMPAETAPPDCKRFSRGIREGDRLPAATFDGESSGEITLRLALMEIGEGEQGPSWTSRALKLLDSHGPFRLAWLETLVRLADWRASAEEQQQAGGGNE